MQLLFLAGFLVICTIGNVVLDYAKTMDYIKNSEKLIKEASEKDDFWNEEKIREYINGAYLSIYLALSHHDLDSLKLYMTENLVQRFEISFAWDNFKQKRMLFKRVHLHQIDFMAINDSIYDDEDAFWVRLSGGYRYKLVNAFSVEDKDKVHKCEYWKFVRVNDCWKLDEIKGEDEVQL